ncbi:hypothetical protein SAMN05444166_3557 [Singulisphaera sp. GP187]|uniref:hypothetical protein n=1 Tax=Singulisphaera sp. GP187 TaxID=1882752 RepID=UPI000925D9F0|nr:hypothetical protein [Singulisphaera sp. GP187]SIO29370.1 hypothetical protein SAMN05444166_3557 [Singulisphaera sp. GP187]
MRIIHPRFTVRRMMATVAFVALNLTLTIPVIRFVDGRLREIGMAIAPVQKFILNLAVAVIMTLLLSGCTVLILTIIRRAQHLKRLLRGEVETQI